MTAPLASVVAHDDITVAAVASEIDLANAALLYDELLRSVSNESRGLVIDLSSVTYLDSAGVRSFFDLARELHISRQLMGIVVPAESPLRRLVKITRLDEVAIVAATAGEAVLAVREAARPTA